MIVSLQLILLLGFRGNSVGIDTETYVTLFLMLKKAQILPILKSEIKFYCGLLLIFSIRIQ